MGALVVHHLSRWAMGFRAFCLWIDLTEMMEYLLVMAHPLSCVRLHHVDVCCCTWWVASSVALECDRSSTHGCVCGEVSLIFALSFSFALPSCSSL